MSAPKKQPEEQQSAPNLPTATTSDTQHEENTNVFRQLFSTLESEHRKLHELEQRRLKLTEEMRNLRNMLQQENKKLRTQGEQAANAASDAATSSKGKPGKQLPRNVSNELLSQSQSEELESKFVWMDAEPVVLVLGSDTEGPNDILDALPAIFDKVEAQPELVSDSAAESLNNLLSDPVELIVPGELERKRDRDSLDAPANYVLPSLEALTPPEPVWQLPLAAAPLNLMPATPPRDITIESELVESTSTTSESNSVVGHSLLVPRPDQIL